MDIAFDHIEFTGKFIIVGDQLFEAVKDISDIIMGANIEMENLDIIAAIQNSGTVKTLLKNSITKKPIVYVDMNNVLVDFPSALQRSLKRILKNTKMIKMKFLISFPKWNLWKELKRHLNS